MINITNLSVAYDKKVIINGLSTSIQEGQITTIVGPNGCGKSTLLKAISKNLSYSTGDIAINNKSLNKISTKKLAKTLAILPQAPKVPDSFTVKELVAFGRYPFIPFGRRMNKKDYDIINWALEKTDMVGYKCRRVNTLSGGERQRAWIAMALTQQPKILLLDEPTTYLDIGHQYEVLELVREIGHKLDMTIVMVLHDINQAITYSDQVIVMEKGKIVCKDSAELALNETTMSTVFGLEGEFIGHKSGKYFIPNKKV